MYRILIVEDDRTIAGALAAHLGRWDYQVGISCCLFIMGFTGVRRSAGLPMCRSFFCLPPMTT